MRILVLPKEIPAKVGTKELGAAVGKLDEEWREVKEAIAEYMVNPSPKNREHLMEEYVDLVTVTLNNMLTLEKQAPEIPDMAWAELQKVALKNYCRGYHHDISSILQESIGKLNRRV